jgi:hypothetical protein
MQNETKNMNAPTFPHQATCQPGQARMQVVEKRKKTHLLIQAHLPAARRGCRMVEKLQKGAHFPRIQAHLPAWRVADACKSQDKRNTLP